MSKQAERARELYGNGPRRDADLKPVAKTIVPGTFGDGQPRMGTAPANVHRQKGVHYEHPKARAYRDALRERPSANRPRSK